MRHVSRMEDVYWQFVHAGKAKDVAALTPSYEQPLNGSVRWRNGPW